MRSEAAGRHVSSGRNVLLHSSSKIVQNESATKGHRRESLFSLKMRRGGKEIECPSEGRVRTGLAAALSPLMKGLN